MRWLVFVLMMGVTEAPASHGPRPMPPAMGDALVGVPASTAQLMLLGAYHEAKAALDVGEGTWRFSAAVPLMQFTDPRRFEAIDMTLQAFFRQHGALTMRFGPLMYRDDLVEQRTELVVLLKDCDDMLQALLDEIADATRATPKALEPTITLASLGHKNRLPHAVEQAMAKRLGQDTFRLNSFYLTDDDGIPGSILLLDAHLLGSYIHSPQPI